MKTALTFLSLFVFGVALIGCKRAAEETASVAGTGSDASIIMDEMPPMLDDAHGHPDHGPHGGELVELGKEDFHIEIVHGSGAVAFYVFDGAVVDPVAIAATKLTVSLKHDGEVKSFELAADPQSGDAAGKSSRFTSLDAQFAQWMDSEAEGAVTVQIQGKSYTGKIAHDHDHAGHSH